MLYGDLFHDSRRGQSMLIAVLSIGSAMLAATTIAGLLILYQLRATTDSVNSSKAIFAADTGIEWGLYNFYKSNGTVGTSSLPSSKATYQVTCYDANSAEIVGGCAGVDFASTSYIVSRGFSLNTSRAFYLTLTATTATFP